MGPIAVDAAPGEVPRVRRRRVSSLEGEEEGSVTDEKMVNALIDATSFDGGAGFHEPSEQAKAARSALLSRLAELRYERDAAREDRDALQRLADLRWAADERAIQRWQAEEPGRELQRPDHADLCCWLIVRFAMMRDDRDAIRAQLAAREAAAREGERAAMLDALAAIEAEAQRRYQDAEHVERTGAYLHGVVAGIRDAMRVVRGRAPARGESEEGEP